MTEKAKTIHPRYTSDRGYNYFWKVYLTIFERTHIETRPYITEILLMGRKESNQTNKHTHTHFEWEKYNKKGYHSF